MREDDPDVSDEAIREAQGRVTVVAPWFSREERVEGSRRTTVEDEGVAEGLPEIRRVIARLTGRNRRPSKLDERIAAIVLAATEIGDGATRNAVAVRLGRVDTWGEEHGAYKRDVSAAGGWDAIKRRAGIA